MRAHFHVKAPNAAYIGLELHVEPETDDEIELAKAFASASQYEITAFAHLKGQEYGVAAYVTFPKKGQK